MKVKGTVKWFHSERGYGFINPMGRPDIDYFVHYTYINANGYKSLQAGREVLFTLVMVDGRPHAKEVIQMNRYNNNNYMVAK